MGFNKTIFIGRLTKDPEIRMFGEAKVANFTLAVDRRFKSKNEDAPTADFIPVTVWRGTADFVEKYFTKGKQVVACGWLETYSYEKDGQRIHSFRINADEVGFADTARSDNGGGQNNGGTGAFSGQMSPGDFSGFDPTDFSNDDDLPF